MPKDQNQIMISHEDEDKPDKNWNKRLLESKFGTIFQTSNYGQYEETMQKIQPRYVKFYNGNGSIVGQILVFQSLRGKTRLTKLVSKLSKLKKQISCTNGPVVFDDNQYNAISEYLAQWLVSSNTNIEITRHPLDEKFSFPKKFNFLEQEAATFIIDLSQNIEDIFRTADKKSVQKNIERAKERGVEISEITTENDIKTYHNILNRYRESNKLNGYTFEQVKAVLSLAKSDGYGAGFLAWHEKAPIGGIFLSAFNGYINEWGIARSDIDSQKKLYSQDLLRWKIIEWGKEKGCKFYDLSGVKLNNQTSKEKGIFQNKKKWGGNLVTYQIFSR